MKCKYCGNTFRTLNEDRLRNRNYGDFSPVYWAQEWRLDDNELSRLGFDPNDNTSFICPNCEDKMFNYSQERNKKEYGNNGVIKLHKIENKRSVTTMQMDWNTIKSNRVIKNDYHDQEIYRQGFGCLIKDKDAEDFDNSPYGMSHFPGAYRVLVDGDYETEFNAETDEEAIQKFKDYFANKRGINNSREVIKSESSWNKRIQEIMDEEGVTREEAEDILNDAFCGSGCGSKGKKKKGKKAIKSAEHNGWVVESWEAQEAYDMACDYFGKEWLDAEIVTGLNSDELADSLAWIFNQYDFQKWDNRHQEIE